MMWEILDSLLEKDKTGCTLHTPNTRINFKWIGDLTVKHWKYVSLGKMKIWLHFYHVGVRNLDAVLKDWWMQLLNNYVAQRKS